MSSSGDSEGPQCFCWEREGGINRRTEILFTAQWQGFYACLCSDVRMENGVWKSNRCFDSYPTLSPPKNPSTTTAACGQIRSNPIPQVWNGVCCVTGYPAELTVKVEFTSPFSLHRANLKKSLQLKFQWSQCSDKAFLLWHSSVSRENLKILKVVWSLIICVKWVRSPFLCDSTEPLSGNWGDTDLPHTKKQSVLCVYFFAY